jgi:hypothetical protein
MMKNPFALKVQRNKNKLEMAKRGMKRTEKVHQKVLQLNLNENYTYTRESLVKLKKGFFFFSLHHSKQ